MLIKRHPGCIELFVHFGSVTSLDFWSSLAISTKWGATWNVLGLQYKAWQNDFSSERSVSPLWSMSYETLVAHWCLKGADAAPRKSLRGLGNGAV